MFDVTYVAHLGFVDVLSLLEPKRFDYLRRDTTTGPFSFSKGLKFRVHQNFEGDVKRYSKGRKTCRDGSIHHLIPRLITAHHIYILRPYIGKFSRGKISCVKFSLILIFVVGDNHEIFLTTKLTHYSLLNKFLVFNFRDWWQPRKLFNSENFPIYGICMYVYICMLIATISPCQRSRI